MGFAMKITDLQTENLISPLGIDNKAPRFGWRCEGAVQQARYRVEVASSPQLLRQGTADLWDSGEIRSRDLTVRYRGKALQSCTRYYWRVTCGDDASEIAWFETAFLDDKEFVAEWIGMPLGFGGAADDVRLDFTVEKPVKRARLYAAALGAGRFWLNGELLDDGYFDGAVSSYHKSVYYRTYELAPRMGNNALCVQLGYGFYGAKKLYAVMRVEFEDGSVSVTPTMAGRVWNVKKSAIVLQSLYDGETRDARLEEDWLSPDYKVSFGNWVATFAADMPRGKLKACPMPPMRIVERFAPVSVQKRDDGYLVDAGRNVCGFCTLKVKGERGARVRAIYAERLLPDGNLDRANLRAAACIDEYILAGEGEENYTPTFTYHGFRYVRIEIEGNAELLASEVDYLRSDVVQSGHFHCSDETLNRLHAIAVQTEGNNLNGVFTDCPQRDERLGWLNDLSSRMYQSVCNFSLERYLPNFVDMITEAMAPDGSIPDTVPFTVGSRIADPVSAYVLLGVLCYELYGDKDVLARNYGGFCRWVGYLEKLANENGGLLAFSLYGDWCPARIFAKDPPWDGHSAMISDDAFISGAYLLWYFAQMQEIARVLGKRADEKAYAEKFVAYKEIFDRKYYHADTRLYGNGSQTECAVALTVFTGAEERVRQKWAKTAADDIAARGYHMTCGNQGYRHLFYRLAEYGYADTLVALLRNPEYPGYGFMLSRGATSVWERWEDVIGSDMHSFNHPMFSGYDGFLYNYIAGIRLHESRPAESEIVIAPCFVRILEFAEASVDTVRGKVSVRWECAQGGYTIAVTAPADARLTVRADGMELSCGKVNGKGELHLQGGTHTVFAKSYRA